MNAELRAITRPELVYILSKQCNNIADEQAVDVISRYAALADPLFLGEIATTPIVVVAFIPMSALSDIAYSWVQVLAGGHHHKHAIARLFKRWKPLVHTRYKQVLAHCSTRPEHLAWLKFTGARVLDQTEGIIKFAIEDNQ